MLFMEKACSEAEVTSEKETIYAFSYYKYYWTKNCIILNKTIDDNYTLVLVLACKVSGIYC